MKLVQCIQTMSLGGAIALAALVVAVNPASAQATKQPTPQKEQPSGCACCKKMMEQMMKDMQQKTPQQMPAGMNHSMPSGK